MTILTRIGFSLIALIIASISEVAHAQEQVGCFMLGANGQAVDLSSLCGSGATGSETPGLYKVKIKRRVAGIPVVDAVINGNSYEMLLDTGASGTVLTAETATELKLKPEGVLVADTPSQQGVRFKTSTVASISVGGATRRNLEVAVAPALDIGLLGQNFFGEYDLTVKESVIELRRR